MTKRQLIRKLNEINLKTQPEDNYSTIYDAVWDYMGPTRGYFLEDIFDDYLDEFHVLETIENNIDDFGAIWEMVRGVNNLSSVYRLDHHGCLHNIDKNDIKWIIDVLFERLEKMPDEEESNDKTTAN